MCRRTGWKTEDRESALRREGTQQQYADLTEFGFADPERQMKGLCLLKVQEHKKMHNRVIKTAFLHKNQL